MDIEEFHRQLAVSPFSFRSALRYYLRNPPAGDVQVAALEAVL